MGNITLTIPNDDHIALRAFGKALEEMALAHGAPLRVNPHVDAEKLRETMENAEPTHIIPEVDTTAQQVEPLAALDNDLPIITVNPTCHALSNEELQERGFDSTGTPWDERIHSASKALNADGTWRLRRKPKDMDEAEWAAFVEGIKACYEVDNSPVQQVEHPFTCEQQPINLDHVSIDPAHDKGDETIEPPVTLPGDDFHTDTNVVTEQTVAGIPPIPVPPPVVIAPPVPEVTTWDFPHLMTFLTERHGKIDVATVNTLLAQDGMSSVQELNAHPDKIGPFVARVKAHLGE